MLAFGGERGANVALMVEVLAAGLTGANWSLDSPSFTAGARSPGAGLFVLALAPQALDPEFGTRLERQLDRLSNDYGVHVPGRRKAAARAEAGRSGMPVDAGLLDRLEAWAAGEA